MKLQIPNAYAFAYANAYANSIYIIQIGIFGLDVRARFINNWLNFNSRNSEDLLKNQNNKKLVNVYDGLLLCSSEPNSPF
jgi:hypothetical protein